MSNPGRTWWGNRFLAALEGFTDSGRLQLRFKAGE